MVEVKGYFVFFNGDYFGYVRIGYDVEIFLGFKVGFCEFFFWNGDYEFWVWYFVSFFGGNGYGFFFFSFYVNYGFIEVRDDFIDVYFDLYWVVFFFFDENVIFFGYFFVVCVKNFFIFEFFNVVEENIIISFNFYFF